jgi:hypothetical protein
MPIKEGMPDAACHRRARGGSQRYPARYASMTVCSMPLPALP